jgi:hypothetical protein
MKVGLVFEKRLDAMPELAEELKNLDFDGGVRVLGSYAGEPCFIFITKAEGMFTVALYTRKKGDSGIEIPDHRLMLKDYEHVGNLMKFLEGEVLLPLEAYSY